MIGLFIGRFQPFHNGHLAVVKKAVKEVDELIIGIGSSQQGHTFENPFSGEERRLMIRKVLETEKIKKCRIVLLPDIREDSEWVGHIRGITGRFDIIYCGTDYTKELFEQQEYPIRDFGRIRQINATEIRKRMLESKKGKPWKRLVPKEVAKFIEKIDGISRIKRIAEKNI